MVTLESKELQYCLFMRPTPHNLPTVKYTMRITLEKPCAWWTDGGQKSGYRTQKKAATPKSCDLINH